jgi:cytosine/adenosine deaminase-related metal-dependent hydrolase
VNADLNDYAMLGTDAASLASQAVFALGRSAICDVAVAGKLLLRDRQHPLAEEIRSRYRQVQRRFQHQEGQ